MNYEYIIIGGDIVPTQSNEDLFVNKNIAELLGEDLKKIVKNAYYRVFNLETPLTDEIMPIIKYGPCLAAAINTVNGLREMDINLFTLANNHILDQGEQGLITTIEVLREAGIKYIGAGINLEEASKSYFLNFLNKRIGFYACAEHEFSIAGDSTPGANPFDPLFVYDHVNKLKNETDYVIVLYHGGKEHYRYPSPNLQRICRRFVDKGADLVICQHSHCIGCEEKYQKGTIVYGQGNFLFDNSNDEHWKTGLLIKLDENMSISYIPVIKMGSKVRLADNSSKKSIIEEFEERSNQIMEKGFVEKQYNTYAESQAEFYLAAFSGKKLILYRLLNKISKGRILKNNLSCVYGINETIRLVNYLDCEAHRELCLRGLNLKYKEKTLNG